jgi:hypothetical protein
MLSFEEASIQKISENLEFSIHYQWGVMFVKYLQTRTFFNEFKANLSLANAT